MNKQDISNDRYPRWEDLTAAERASFGNGCGPDWLPDLVGKVLFGWYFEASCRHHDFGYTVGGDEARRLHCDRRFYEAMIRDLSRIRNPIYRLAARLEASVLYRLVRIGGKKHFHYGEPRTIEDIRAMIRLN